MDKNVVITDTSCFILLDKINLLHILRDIYGKVLTTPEIAAEYKKELPGWIEITKGKNRELISLYNQQVDLGEASAIALAQEISNALLVIDDFKGRKLASQLNIKFTGTIGILIAARQQKKIVSLRPYFDAINLTDFRINTAILHRILDDYKD